MAPLTYQVVAELKVISGFVMISKVVLEAEALQKSLDTELDRCQKLMEDKRQLENERKEYDKLRAQVMMLLLCRVNACIFATKSMLY